ncbi:Basic leucine zipper 19 [Linum perenne]
MEDGEVEFSNQEVFSATNMGEFPSSGSMDSFFDELLKDTHACTHTHTCNPPGPDYSHTHTCFHVHTKIVSGSSEDKGGSDEEDTSGSVGKKSSKKRPLGNREAVRKYREKKKARAASLEDEVVKLRAINQQLMRRLQGQAALEAEVARLKCLLVDIRGRIEGEIGSFPYQKPNLNLSNPNGAYVMNPCNMQCNDQAYCLHPGMDGKSGGGDGGGLNGNGQVYGGGGGGCDFENLQCMMNDSSGTKDFSVCGVGNGVANGMTTGSSKRKGANAATVS